MENSKFKLILASNSPRRKELLGHLKIPFQIMSKNVPEESNATDPQQFCLDIASLKGQAVLEDLKQQYPKDNFFVISADTIVCLNGKIYGKPQNRTEARSFLAELSHKSHDVYTAVVVKTWKNGIESGFSFVDKSIVTFDDIDEALMNNYLDTGDSLDKAGAYGIQGPSLTFISEVRGSYSNVVGFPLSRFVQEAKKFFGNEVLWSKYFVF